jgi:corticotropin releasing hormone receptor 1
LKPDLDVLVEKFLVCCRAKAERCAISEPLTLLQVLITKLRATNNAETQQYRKATKALLVLIPLLGITYILVITGPAEGMPAAIYDYVTAVLLSTQVIPVLQSMAFMLTMLARLTLRKNKNNHFTSVYQTSWSSG